MNLKIASVTYDVSYASGCPAIHYDNDGESIFTIHLAA